MAAPDTFTVVLAPIADAQMDAALLWWSRNRPAAPDSLAREIERALRLIERVPQVGRRTKTPLFRNVRRLLLSASGYHLYYQFIQGRREVRVVYFRHAKRRPLRG